MPWIWNPLWGNVWVGVPARKKTAGQGGRTRVRCAGCEKRRYYNPVVEQKDGQEPVRSEVIEKNIKDDILIDRVNQPSPASGFQNNNNLENKFEQVEPGVYKFKHSTAMPKVNQNKSLAYSGKFAAAELYSALPGDLCNYKRVGTAGDGTPVFTFS